MIDIENRFKRWLTGEGPRPPLGNLADGGSARNRGGHGLCGLRLSGRRHGARAHRSVGSRRISCARSAARRLMRWCASRGTTRCSSSAFSMQALRRSWCPSCRTAEEARQAVSFAKYPPEGVRGVAAVHRGSRFGRATDYLKRANGRGRGHRPARDARCNRAAAGNRGGSRCRCASSSAPAILSAAMGHIGNITHPDVQALIQNAAQGRPCSRKARRHRRPQSRHGSPLHRLRLRLCRRRFRHRHDDEPGIGLARYAAGRACSSAPRPPRRIEVVMAACPIVTAQKRCVEGRFGAVDRRRHRGVLARRNAADARDAGRGASREGLVRQTSSYPLIPYSNRIAHGRFSFQGIEHQLALNFGDHPHSIHGNAWQSPWQVDEATDTHCRLSLLHTTVGGRRGMAFRLPGRAGASSIA